MKLPIERVHEILRTLYKHTVQVANNATRLTALQLTMSGTGGNLPRVVHKLRLIL